METSICRCCASEGAFKDVKSTYHWMGEEEIYADMLKECFDINLFQPEGAEDSGICEVCITQLRNAVNFKKQVLHTEEQFKKQLQSGKMFKPSIVKVEVPMEHHDSDDDDHASAEDGYSEPDFEIPIKIEDTEETEKRPKSKKRAAPVKKSTSTRAKKAKIEEGEPSTKRTTGCDTEINSESVVSKLSLKPKTRNDWTVTIKQGRPQKKELVIDVEPIRHKEIKMQLHNIRTILLYSNATPIRSHGAAGYMCSFCKNQYTNALDLKIHTLNKHDSKEKLEFMKGSTLLSYVVKLDITGLQCEICNKGIDKLHELVSHLINDHNIKVFVDVKDYILPFKFDTNTLQCTICSSEFYHFKLLQDHMNVHYQNYVCEVCGTPFVNKLTLKRHAVRHEQGVFNCGFCTKVFNTRLKKVYHERCVHITSNKRNKCPYCDEKFVVYAERNEHMVKVHGTEPLILKCKACDQTFTRQDKLSKHVKKDHLLERRYACDICDMRFYSRKNLAGHMVKHTDVKNHRCEICQKAYARKNTLREHIKIHANDRRFKCGQCGQSFVQKCSWKSHMRSRHGEYV